MADANTSPSGPALRPLSPHLSIYRPMLSMMMSIVHRVTGAALYVGTLLIAWWVIAAASGPNPYATFEWVMGSIIGKLVLFGYTWALLHHMLGGIRHLIWDTGRGFDLASVKSISWMTIIGSLILTVAVWAFGLKLTGVI